MEPMYENDSSSEDNFVGSGKRKAVSVPSAFTTLDIEKCEFKFSVGMFSWILENDEIINSPIYKGQKSSYEWVLSIDPKPKVPEDFGLYLQLHGGVDNEKKVKANYSLTLLNADGRVLKELGIDCTTFNEFTLDKAWGWIIPRSEILPESLSFDILKIHVRLWAQVGLKRKLVGENFEEQFEQPQSSKRRKHEVTSDLLSKLRRNTSSSDDVKLLVKSKLLGYAFIPAHRCVLSVMSPVFKKIFDSIGTNNNDHIRIPEEFDFETVNGMFDFIYYGETSILSTKPKELMLIADHFQLLELKTQCEQILIKNLNAENASECFVFAQKLNATGLMDEAAKISSPIVKKAPLKIIRKYL